MLELGFKLLFFLKKIRLMYLFYLFLPVFMGTSCRQKPMEVRRKCWIPCKWSYRGVNCHGCWELNPGLLQEQ